MRTSTVHARRACRLFLMTCLAWPMLTHAAPEFYLQGSPDKYLPDMVPPTAQRQEHKGPVSYQGPPADYHYSWQFKDRKGISRTVSLRYSVYEPLSTRYSYGADVKSNTMAAFLNATGYARSRVCWNTQSGAKENYTIRATDMDRSYLQTCTGDVSKEIKRKPAPISSYAYLTLHNYSDKSLLDQEFRGHYGNVAVAVIISMSDNSYDASTVGLAAISRLSGKLPTTSTQEESSSESSAAPPPVDDGPRFEVYALPSAAGGPETRIAYLPASNKLPAKLVAKAKPGTTITFSIREGRNGILQSGSSTGQQVAAKANSAGLAEALFYYNGGRTDSALTYQVQVSKPGEKDVLTVHVGLGLVFERIKAVKGDMRDTYPFTLTVRSRFHPKLRLGNYFTAAKANGLWNDLTVGVRLGTTWVNMPAGAPLDEAFRGTATISDTPEGENLLVVASNEAHGKPQYYLTNYLYPAVVMKSDGRHAYKIDGELVLLNANGMNLGSLEESLRQSDVLAIVARDTPEHWLTSLVCSLEVTSTEQYVMLETAKMLPVGGTAVELLTSATGLMCKFGQAEYESLFYDIGTILGGKYLDHLMEPEVFDKLTPKQQTAAQLAKKAYDELDEYKQDQEREKWLKNPLRPPAPASTQPEPPQAPATGSSPNLNEAAKDAGKAIEEGVGKSVKELRDTLKGIFRSR